MKITKFLLVIAAFLMLGTDYMPISEYVPVLMKRTDMENAVKLDSPRPMEETGKLYYKAPYLFIIEKYKGVHIIDNTDPTNPEKINFLHIDGIRDIAIKDDVLYADNAVDLIAIQFDAAITSITMTKRMKDYFPEMTPPDGWGVAYSVWANRPNDTIIVGWKKRTS